MAPITPQHKPGPINTKSSETKQECFERHFTRCFLKTGDRVRFKKPKKRPIYGVVDHVETDISKMFWSESSDVPKYIRISIDLVDKSTGEITGYEYVWTAESKIIYVPPAKG
jgi:hypothetical protein